MRKIIELLDRYADAIILAFIRVGGFACLFFAGILYEDNLHMGFNKWAVAGMLIAFFGFLLSRIFVNLIEKAKRSYMPKKRSKREIMNRAAALNEARRKRSEKENE